MFDSGRSRVSTVWDDLEGDARELARQLFTYEDVAASG